jgi:hypothetical protein
MLAKNRIWRCTIGGNFSLDSAIVQQSAELDQAALPLLAGYPRPINLRHPFRDSGKENAAELSVGQLTHHLFPESKSQVGVILPQTLMCQRTGLVLVFRPPTRPVLDSALDQTRAQQPRQSISHRCAGHTEEIAHFIDRERTTSTNQIQELTIRRI